MTISRRLLLPLTSLWLTLLIVASFMPARDKVRLGTISQDGKHVARGDTTLMHRLGHVGGFGLAALLLILLAEGEYPPWKAGLGALFLGVTLEVIEPMVLFTVFEWWDIRDDAIGVAVVIVCCEAWRRRRA